ncbi:MAG: NADH-quinone oxidoreductase subunit N [Candidatus Marinimicrobia bacterium]|jgi:NADH-quinone oxidoreductase subunit N|nr:NADH-quinone oxidoreductase subunit N [Candidatus Neomarinimicrobiota bacterium]MDP6610894.1 NADH-quinone oxidoreductase subunit N [Candidatus Neomarinimicrobiota bacterium]|tara:strand:- start:10151 stop:11641 length:1491 start_codon:yes stop_codon:yes gene_type:complete
MSNLHSLTHFWPELILTITVLAAIISDLIYRREESFKVAWWVLGGLVLTLFAIQIGGSTVSDLFMGTIALDPFSEFFKVLVLISTIAVVLMSFNSNELKDYRMGEYYSVLAIMAIGLFLMASAIDVLMVYLALEVVSIMSFFLAGYLKKNPHSNEASLKYVIYGAFSSGIMLYGLSILFGLTGTTKFIGMQTAIANLGPDSNLALILSAVFILAGFGYKISAVPFHFWTPDVYEGSPTTITAYLSVAPKAAGFAMMIRFFNQVFGDSTALVSETWSTINGIPWPQLMGVLAAVTMTVGNMVAIQQDSVKRMLAYSSIAHAGYMMMALPLMSEAGVYGIMIYLLMYLFMNLGAFFVVIYVQGKFGGEDFDNFDGLGWKMPFVGVVMTLFMFSLTGLPPTAGFIGKFYLFAAVIKAGTQYYWLAIVGALNSVVSLYYYIRVVKHMFLKGERSESVEMPASSLVTILLLAMALPTFILGWYFAPVVTWISESLVIFQGM